MTVFIEAFARLSPFLLRAAIVTALAMAVAVIAERAAFGMRRAMHRRLTLRYRPIVRRAIDGDEASYRELLASPSRHRLALGWMLIEPLIADRNVERIARTRAIADALAVFTIADGYLRSWWWWRRALALRALGLAQAADYTSALITALDDAHPDVRAAALDGLADMHDLTALQAIIVRVHDTSLHRGRRGAAIKAFGSECESFLLEMSEVDPANRLNYIHALAICGTARSRPVLCRWTRDPRIEVRATAFEALAYVGLDDHTAAVVIEGLDSDEPRVRAMAAFALRGWQGTGDAAARLASRLDDTWAVAVRAARTLQSMGPDGAVALQTRASDGGLAGTLARQMLWRPDAQR
jgi:HEAT repeat protein